MSNSVESGRTLGLIRATMVGVGAIVGGGVLALAGTAFAEAGPAAIIAFALNGVIAFITARSFAGMAGAFPKSGGSYTYAKMVLSVRAAFAVGWVVWFASIVAGVLYALGFAVYAVLIIKEVYSATGGQPPPWLDRHSTVLLIAGAATAFYTFNLLRKSAGGGNLETIGKVIIFAVFIVFGLIVLGGEPSKVENVSPFLPMGMAGLVSAMGFTFIALQGFDLIAAVGGEVKDPKRNIPRAMYLSLAVALVIYMPLLFVVMTVGVADGNSITRMGTQDPDALIVDAARNIMGDVGFWLIAVAALLAMLSALQANMYAASRIALAMARERTLPWAFAKVSEKRGIPVGGVLASSGLLVLILLVIPDVASAGAAASLIFLVTFALVHVMAFLARKRGAIAEKGVFKWLPILGMVLCTALALFQGIVVPLAGVITAVWMTVGAVTYFTVFARRAEAVDAADAARNPLIGQARGANPLVLLPVANPASAVGLVSVAYALTPPVIGRVLLLSVVQKPDKWEPPEPPPTLREMQAVLGDTLTASLARGLQPEALTTVAHDTWDEIARIANTRGCRSLLLGMSKLDEKSQTAGNLERLMSAVDSDVVVLRAAPEWSVGDTKRILVPVGGKGYQDTLRARMLGSLSRTADREVIYMRVLPANTDESDAKKVEKELFRFAQGEAPGFGRAMVIRSDDAIAEVVKHTSECDLTIIGVQRLGKRKKLFGNFAMKVVAETQSALMLISRSG